MTAAETSRRHEAVIETIRAVREAESTEAGLSTRLVQHVDTVAPAMAARYTGRLAVETHSHAAHGAELAHSILLSTERIEAHVSAH